MSAVKYKYTANVDHTLFLKGVSKQLLAKDEIMLEGLDSEIQWGLDRGFGKLKEVEEKPQEVEKVETTPDKPGLSKELDGKEGDNKPQGDNKLKK